MMKYDRIAVVDSDVGSSLHRRARVVIYLEYVAGAEESTQSQNAVCSADWASKTQMCRGLQDNKLFVHAPRPGLISSNRRFGVT
jgi:hypothetical protein